MKSGILAVGLFALGVASLQMNAQAAPQATTASNVTFEVASIRRNKEEEERRTTILLKDPNAPIAPGRAQTRPGGNFEGLRMSVGEMIRDAYGYRNKPAADPTGRPRRARHTAASIDKRPGERSRNTGMSARYFGSPCQPL